MASEVPAWRQWISEKLNPVQPSIAAQEPFSSPENIVDFEQAYREIEVVHRSVDIIINALIEVPLRIEGGSPSKKVNKLLNSKPNPFEDRVRLFRRAFLDFFLDGNAFFYYDKETEGGALYVIPANDMEIVPDERAFVSHYNYLLRNQSESDLFGYGKARKAEAIQFLPDEIIHIKSENEDSIFRGYSRLRPLERLFELYYYMINFQRQFFKNNAVPGFVLTTDNVLSQKIKYRILEAWRQSYTSLFNGARSPAILDGGLKIDKFSQVNFNELDFENSIERIQQDMAKALGVPYVLLKSGNNANISANQVLFYDHTVLPILEQFCSAFAHFFNNNVSIRPDKTAILALQPDNRTQAVYYSTLVNTGIITPNEAREGLRFPTLQDGDSDNIRIPQNITGSATDATQGGRPNSQEDTSGNASTEETSQ
jgi:HK97 family phage portal protein